MPLLRARAGVYTVTFGLVLGPGLFRLGRTTPRAIGWHSSSLARDVAIGCAGFIAITLILVAGIAVAVDSPREFVDEALSFSPRQRLLFVAIGLEGAVLEESLWRGYLQPGLISRFGRPAGIVLTALLFAVAHFQFRPVQFLLKFAVGLVLGLLRERDRSLVPPAIAHFLTWLFHWLGVTSLAYAPRRERRTPARPAGLSPAAWHVVRVSADRDRSDRAIVIARIGAS